MVPLDSSNSAPRRQPALPWQLCAGRADYTLSVEGRALGGRWPPGRLESEQVEFVWMGKVEPGQNQ